MRRRRDPPRLAAAVDHVLNTYDDFIARVATPEPEAKSFSAYHVGARAALAHIEHLYKVAAAFGGDPPDAATAVLAATRAAMAATPEEEEDADHFDRPA